MKKPVKMKTFPTRPQKYKNIETGEVVKIERRNSQYVVVTSSEGMEKMNNGKVQKSFEHIGNWNE